MADIKQEEFSVGDRVAVVNGFIIDHVDYGTVEEVFDNRVIVLYPNGNTEEFVIDLSKGIYWESVIDSRRSVFNKREDK